MLDSLCLHHTRQRYLGRVNPSWENIPPNQPIRKRRVWFLDWYFLREGPAHLNVDTLGWLSWMLYESMLKSKPVRSTSPWPWHQFLLPGSCPVWVPSLIYCCDGLWWGSIAVWSPSSPSCLWPWCFYHSPCDHDSDNTSSISTLRCFLRFVCWAFDSLTALPLKYGPTETIFDQTFWQYLMVKPLEYECHKSARPFLFHPLKEFMTSIRLWLDAKSFHTSKSDFTHLTHMLLFRSGSLCPSHAPKGLCGKGEGWDPLHTWEGITCTSLVSFHCWHILESSGKEALMEELFWLGCSMSVPVGTCLDS